MNDKFYVNSKGELYRPDKKTNCYCHCGLIPIPSPLNPNQLILVQGLKCTADCQFFELKKYPVKDHSGMEVPVLTQYCTGRQMEVEAEEPKKTNLILRK